MTFQRFNQIIAPLFVFLGIFLVWCGLEALDRLQIGVPALCGGILVGGIGVWHAKHKVVVILLTATVAIVVYMMAVVYALSFD
jgi:hypothetical protein